MKKKIFAVALATMALISLLAGCSMGQMTAEKIIEKSQENPADNCRMEAQMDLALSVSAGEGEEGAMSFDIPISLSVDMETAGELSHGKITAKLSMMGQSQKTTSEFYSDSEDHYSSEDGSSWVRRDADSIDFMSRIDPEIFSGAEASYDKEKDVHTLTAPTNKFVGFQVGSPQGYYGAIASRRSKEHGYAGDQLPWNLSPQEMHSSH